MKTEGPRVVRRRAGKVASSITSGLMFLGAALYGACSSDPVGQAPDASVDATASDAGKDAAKASLCVDGKPSPYPTDTKIDLFATMPPLEFPKLGGGTYSLASKFEPCAPRSKILLFRTTAAFCGTCLWSQNHTADVIPKGLEDRVELVDLVVSDKNNVLVQTSDDLARVEAELGPHAATVAADPAYRFQSVGLGDRRLPFFVLVDSRTMLVRRFVPDPEPETLDSMVRREVAMLDGNVPPPFADVKYVDEFFPTNHFDMLKEMTLPGAPPKDPTNAVADSPLAAALGKDIFSDTRLAPNGAVACATCHAQDKGFADAKARAVGVAEGDRNSPSILYASHSRFQFWDGRADTLWLQATGPFENPIEIGSNRLFVAHKIYALYKDRYEAIFPTSPLPPLNDGARFPANGKPGDAAWDAMAPADQAAVNQVFVRVAKVLEAFERTLSAKGNQLDRYVGGDFSALTEDQKQGLHIFFTAGCAQCHYGPRLTDDAFHNIRFPTGRRDGKPDLGASVGLAQLFTHEFRKPEYADGAFQSVFLPKDMKELEGAFRTPQLRGMTATAPYGHGGNLATLDDVAKHYGLAGLEEGDPRTIGRSEPWVPNFVDEHRRELVPLLELFKGELVVP